MTMTYPEFCATVNSLLAGKPASTGLRVGTGHILLDDVGSLVALAEGDPLEDALEFDSSHWEDGALVSMTPELIAQALAAPEFCQFNRTIIELHAENDRLHFDKEILLCIYGAGDCDTIVWPAPDMANLKSALYDLRETSNLVSGACEFAKLPDGTIVQF